MKNERINYVDLKLKNMQFSSDNKLFFVHIILLLIIVFIPYSHIFRNSFVVDDDDFIARWDATRNFGNLPLFLKGLTPEGHEGVYRPIRTILYSVAYKLFRVNPSGYHLFSIIIHLSSTILIYLILVSTLHTYLIPFVSAIFFAIHPIHTESITYITSSFDMPGIVFLLLSFYLYIKYTLLRKRLHYGLSVLFSIVAYFNYEVALVFPLLLMLYNLCFKVTHKIKVYIPYITGALFYIIARLLFIGVGGKGGYVLNSFYYTMLLMPKAFFKYISLMFFPINLDMNHELYPGIYSMLYVGYDKGILSSYSFYDPRVLIPLIIIGVIIYIGVRSYEKRPTISFCIGWFFISLVAVSNIIPTGIIMAEKYLYLASFGYCLLLSCFIIGLYQKKNLKYLSYIIFCIFSLFYFKTTIIRNLEWCNPLFLWDTEAKRFPENPIANNNLGYTYMKMGGYTEALRYLNKAKELAPYDLQVRENLQVCYIKSGRYQEAINECKEILEIAPGEYDYYKIYVNLSAAFNGKGMFGDSIVCSKKALELKPDCQEAYNNLILAYINKGDYPSAMKYYNEAIDKGLSLTLPPPVEK